MEPPADIEQYSNSPSKMGLSSPTLSVEERIECGNTFLAGLQRTLLLLPRIVVGIFWVDAMQKLDVIVRVKLRHLASCRWLRSLETVMEADEPFIHRCADHYEDGMGCKLTKISIFL